MLFLLLPLGLPQHGKLLLDSETIGRQIMSIGDKWFDRLATNPFANRCMFILLSSFWCIFGISIWPETHDDRNRIGNDSYSSIFANWISWSRPRLRGGILPTLAGIDFSAEPHTTSFGCSRFPIDRCVDFCLDARSGNFDRCA